MEFLTEPAFSLPMGKEVRLFRWESGDIWVAYQHREGHWVSLRKATEADKKAFNFKERP